VSVDALLDREPHRRAGGAAETSAAADAPPTPNLRPARAVPREDTAHQTVDILPAYLNRDGLLHDLDELIQQLR